MREQPRDLVHARGDVDRLENLLLLFRLDVHVGGRQVGKRRRRVDRLDGAEQILRHLRQELDRLDGLRLQIDETRLDLRAAHARLRDLHDARDHERPAGQELADLEALLALADEVMPAVRRGDVAHDVGDRAHAMHVDRRRIGDLRVALHENADLTLIAHGLLGRGDRLLPAKRHREHHAGKQHGAAHRHDDQRVGWYWRQRTASGCFFQLNFSFSHDSFPLSAN